MPQPLVIDVEKNLENSIEISSFLARYSFHKYDSCSAMEFYGPFKSNNENISQSNYFFRKFIKNAK